MSGARRSAGWVPEQHGAWAMVTVPVLTGVALAGPHWVHLPLVLVWWTAFFLFNAGGLWLRSRRKPRYLPAVGTYGLACAVLGVAVLVVTPHLVRWLPVFAVLIAVTAWASAHRRDRSLLNDAVTIAAAGLMTAVAYDAPLGWGTPVTATAGLPGASPDGQLQGWAWTWLVTGLLTAYFWGTAPYVKTLIRERGQRRYLVGSVAYHVGLAVVVAVLAAGGWVRWVHAAVWALLAARAGGVPWWQRYRPRPLRPAAIGAGEVAASLAVVLTLVL